jgi:hypothetical protein
MAAPGGNPRPGPGFCAPGGIGYCSHARRPRGNPDRKHADIAQLVERNLAKVEVASSSLVVRSEKVSSSTVEWPRGEATDCKSVYTGSNPVSTSIARSCTWAKRAIGAAVARFLDTEEVTGSNPVSPTSTIRPLTSGNASRGPFCIPARSRETSLWVSNWVSIHPRRRRRAASRRANPWQLPRSG